MQAQQAQQKTTLTAAYGAAFEREVIWLTLFDPDFATIIFGACEHDVFETPEYVAIYETARNVYMQRKQHVNASVIETEIVRAVSTTKRKSPRYMLLLRSVACIRKATSQQAPLAATRVYVKEKLGEYIVRNKLKNALLDSVELFDAGNYDEVLDTIKSAVNAKEKTLDQDLGADFNDFVKKYASYKTKSVSKKHSPIGIPIIDALMRGGLEPQTLGLFMAPAKRGKSLIQCNTGAEALLRGLNVAQITLELSVVDYSLRYDARLTGIAINQLAANPQKYIKQVAQATLALKGQLRIKGYGSNQATVADLYNWLTALKHHDGFVPDVVLVDYADLLMPTKSRGERRHELGDIVRALRQLATDFDCAVWTASQTRRESFKTSVLDLSDVAEDIQKVQIADAIIGICQTQDEKNNGKMRVALLGNRFGGSEGRIVDCHVDSSTQSIRESATQTSAAAGRYTKKYGKLI